LQLEFSMLELALLISMAAGLATGIGALPIIVRRSPGRKTIDFWMGFAAGVMLAVVMLSLLVPALEVAGVWVVSGSFAVGALVLFLADHIIPHVHDSRHEGRETARTGAWLPAIAMAIHNFPEGLAVGVAFGSGDIATGFAIALAIGLHNIPEGMAICAPLTSECESRSKPFIYSILAGLAEPVGAVIGVILVSSIAGLIPFGLGFAAGAMIYVVSDEMVPESHSAGHESIATTGLIIGFILMMVMEAIIA
jgi:ZIP family zinc transporter